MNVQIGLLIFIAVVVTIDLGLDFMSRPMRRRAAIWEDAQRAVLAAAQIGGSNEDKAKLATQFLLDQHPTLKPAAARLKVEHAVAVMKKGAKA